MEHDHSYAVVITPPTNLLLSYCVSTVAQYHSAGYVKAYTQRPMQRGFYLTLVTYRLPNMLNKLYMVHEPCCFH